MPVFDPIIVIINRYRDGVRQPSTFVLVHGSFRGGWYWDPVASALREQGHRVFAPSLAGMGEHRHHAPLLAAAGPVERKVWVNDVVHLCTYQDLHDIVLVGHSLGGVIASEAADRLGAPRVRSLVYLDAPVLSPGQTPADLYPPRPADAPHSDPSGWTQPMPVNADEISDVALQQWMAERLTPNPNGPGLGPLIITDETAWRSIPAHVAFCSRTPAMFPSARSRIELDVAGRPYDVIEAGHDAPVSATHLVVDWLIQALS